MSDAFVIYQKTREHYFFNAQETIQKCEFRKASELLWGAITQSIKSLASLSNIPIRKHSDFNSFLIEVSKATGNKNIYESFLELQSLHRNFYDEVILEQDFPYFYEKVINFLEMIDKLIQEQLKGSR